jgi:uncharacterized OB-fold protein
MNTLSPYFEGVAKRQLLVPHCKSCGKPHFYPRYACPSCWGENYDWKPAVGTGTVHSYTTVLANPPSNFVALLPFRIAIIELDEGVRMLSNVVGDEPLAVGDKVVLEFIEREGSNLPVFRAAKG